MVKSMSFCNKAWPFQIHHTNKEAAEESIRDALKSFMKPEDVEEELRKAIEGLNLAEVNTPTPSS